MRSGTSPYSVVRRLGNGGMADVFLARDSARGGRLVALKRLRTATPELVIHFTREARIGVQLVHPHVVQVEDAGIDAEGPYLVLEFVQGVSASTLMRFLTQQRSPVPVEHWQVLARDVAEGLHYAHSAPMQGGARGVLHRDLSPDNVLVSDTGVAKLSDFGLAYMTEDTRLTNTGSVKGKVAYLAPELFESGAPSTASDVYALGVVLFRLASGMLPFRGNNDGELILNILHGERPRLSALRPDLPGPLADWVQQAIGQRREERPALETLLALLPAAPMGAEPRRRLARAVVAAREQAESQPELSWQGTAQTQALRLRPVQPSAVSAEETERVPAVELESAMPQHPVKPGRIHEPTERLPSVQAPPVEKSQEATERAPAVFPPAAEPARTAEAATEQLPSVLSELAAPEKDPAALPAPSVPGPPAAHSWRKWVWLSLLVAGVLALVGLLALRSA